MRPLLYLLHNGAQAGLPILALPVAEAHDELDAEPLVQEAPRLLQLQPQVVVRRQRPDAQLRQVSMSGTADA